MILLEHGVDAPFRGRLVATERAMRDPLLVDVYYRDVKGTPDWPALVGAGPPWHGAIVKVSEGVGGFAKWQVTLSEWFRKQWPAIRAAAGDRYGIDFFRGGYHYLLAGVDGAAQADHYLKQIEDAGGWDHGDLWPIVDVEEGSGNKARSRQEVIDSATAFVETVRAKTSRGVVLYGGWWLASMEIRDKMGCSWLWYPSYTRTLPAASHERIGWTSSELLAWQYAGDGVGKTDKYPMRSPLGDTDISAVTIDGGGANALEWLRTNLQSRGQTNLQSRGQTNLQSRGHTNRQPRGQTRVRVLHVTSPMMTGADVFDVQQKLAALGYTTGVLDGAYGPTTAAAVRAFQRDHALPIDGIIGLGTRAALAAATRPAQPVSSLLGEQALAEAMKHVGVKEFPPSSNRTMFGAWFGVNGVAWCNIFVSYCFSVGAGYTIADGYPGGRGAGIYKGKGSSYVPTTEAWLRATGMWIGRVPPQPGDIAIFNWNGGQPDHIGIVAKDLGNGSFESIEGNTALGNDSDGGQVMRRVRHLTQVNGFGRIAD